MYGYTAISHGSNHFRFRGGMSKLDHHWTAKIRNPGGVTTLFDTRQETICVLRYCISSISYLSIYVYMNDMCMCLVRLFTSDIICIPLLEIFILLKISTDEVSPKWPPPSYRNSWRRWHALVTSWIINFEAADQGRKKTRNEAAMGQPWTWHLWAHKTKRRCHWRFCIIPVLTNFGIPSGKLT